MLFLQRAAPPYIGKTNHFSTKKPLICDRLKYRGGN